MRVLLSGTSNAILARGFSHGFATDPRVTRFTNLSLGASTTVAIGRHLAGADLAGHDLCVIDYAVNEEVILAMGRGRVEDAISNVAALADAASRAGCRPVIAVFPDANRLGGGHAFDRALRAAFVRHGVPVFSLIRLIERLSALTGRPGAEMFLDPRHVRREIAAFAASAIVAALDRPEALRLVETGERYAPLALLPIAAVTVEGPAARQTRSSRLATCEVLALAPGARLRLPPVQAELAGVVYNAARSWGRLTDATGEALIEPEAATLFSLARELTLVAMPLSRPLPLGEGAVLEHGCPPLPADLPPPGFEIEGLILRLRDSPGPLGLLVAGAPGAELADLPSDADLLALAASLAA